MGFPIKYETDKERLAAIRQSENNYSIKPFTCSQCRVTIQLGNKQCLLNTDMKIRGNIEQMYQHAEHRCKSGLNQV